MTTKGINGICRIGYNTAAVDNIDNRVKQPLLRILRMY
jgi:hypothetical protein